MNDTEKEELFEQISKHLLEDEKPSEYIKELSRNKQHAKYPLSMLWELKSTEQSPKYHPEGSVWNHTMLVLDEAARVRDEVHDPKVFMWAALLHDIGKPITTRSKNGKITSYDHDKAGEKLCTQFLNFFTGDRTFIKNTSALVRYHMHMLYVLKKLPYQDVKGLMERVNPKDIALLCRCDRLGRLGADLAAEEDDYSRFLDKLLEKQKINV